MNLKINPSTLELFACILQASCVPAGFVGPTEGLALTQGTALPWLGIPQFYTPVGSSSSKLSKVKSIK